MLTALALLPKRLMMSSSINQGFRKSTGGGDWVWQLIPVVTVDGRSFNGRGGVPVSSQILMQKEKDDTVGMSLPVTHAAPRVEVENFLKEIYGINTAAKLADFLETSNFQSLDDRDINTLFGALFKAVRYETSDAAKKELLNCIGMQKVLKAVKQYCRWLNVGEIITVIKFLAFLNISGSHPTLQILLRLASKQANTMTLQEIIYVSFLLEKIESSTMITALQLALPVIFESHLSSKLDKSDPNLLCDALHYSVRHSLSDSCVQKIIDDLVPQMSSLSPRQNMSVIWSIADSRRRLLRQDTLLTPALKKLADSVESFSEEELNLTVSRLSKKYTKNSTYFYNEDLMGRFCHLLSETDKDPTRALFALRSITQMKHVDVAYLDRVAEIILSNPSLVLNNDYLFSIVLRGFSSANYKPGNWDKLEPVLLNHPFLTKEVELGLIPVLVDLLSLGCFPAKLIEKVFSPPAFPILEQYVKFHSPYIPLLILKSIKLLCPEYNGPLPPNSMIKDWKTAVVKIPKNYPLKAALQSGIGGTNYVLSGLFHEGFHIDHAIAFRKGGYPVALDVKEPVLLEELQLPPESEIVMVKALMPECYASNTNRLRGIYAHELNLIENLDYSVIAVNMASWKELPDSEKIPYLMHKIREKCESKS